MTTLVQAPQQHIQKLESPEAEPGTAVSPYAANEVKAGPRREVYKLREPKILSMGDNDEYPLDPLGDVSGIFGERYV